MRIGEFWEEDAVVPQSQKKQDVTAPPNKVPSHMANSDRNNGLI